MRILVFLPCLTLGGAERQGLLLARYLKERGHDVEVWGFPPPGGRATLVPELRHNRLRYEELSSWPELDWRFSQNRLSSEFILGYYRWYKRLRTFGATLPRRKFDAVIPFTFWPSLISCLMREKLRADKCYWNHRGGYDDAGVLHNSFLVRQVLGHNPRFLANSRAGAKFLQDTFALSSNQVAVIPNTYVADIDVSKVELATIESRSTEPSLIQVANFFPEKDYDTALRALKILNAQGADCRLHFCGTFLCELDRVKFLARVRELGIEHWVVHHGSVARRDVFRLLLNSDIGLLSSRSEGQPNSIMEYMHVGLPIVATNIPGIRDIVGEENEKYLFEVGDARRLASVVHDLREKPGLRAELGRRNRQRIIEHFGPTQVLPQWAMLVESR